MRRSGRQRWFPVALLCAAILFAHPGTSAAQPGAQGGGPVQLNFEAVDLAFVLSALAQMAGLNLIYHDLPSKPITLRTAQAVPRASIPTLIRSLAAANGVAVIEDATFLRLVGTGAGDQADTRQLYIYRLQHARATTLSNTLSSLFGGARTATAAAALRPPLSQQLQQLQAGPQAAVNTPQTVVIQGPVQGGAVGNVLMVPDEVTNSLLVRATPTDWAIIQQAVQALDLRPLQVVIEVVIAEVRHTNDLDVGLTVGGSTNVDGVSVTGDLPASTTTPTDAFSVTLEGIRVGNVDIDATLAALSASGRVRILSRPVIMAQNNQQARILVGTQQPFIQLSQTLPTDPTGARAEVVQYREVGTVLSILPTINQDGYVNLTLGQEVSNATAETQFGAPIISTREAETQLLARNGQTVVIGGLVDEQVSRTRQGIPLLKDIPILGFLFGSTQETRGSSELFLFLTPYIVATDEDADRLRDHIEGERELLEPFVPVVPLSPPVVTPITPAQPAATPVPGAQAPAGVGRAP